MVKAFVNIQKLDWGTWLLGLIGAFISGGAGAVSAAFGTMIADPEHFNVTGGGLSKVLTVMGITFLITGLVSLAKFLQVTPVPTPLAQKVETAAAAAAETVKAVEDVKASLPEPKP